MVYAYNEEKGKVDIDAILNGLQTNYQNNVNTIYNAFVNKGVTPTAKTPTALSTAVNTTYNKGVTDAQAITWTETLVAQVYRLFSGSGLLDFDFCIPCKNTIKIKNVSNKSIRLSVVKNTGTENVTLANNAEYTPNGNILRIMAGIHESSAQVDGITVEVTFQAKVLR